MSTIHTDLADPLIPKALVSVEEALQRAGGFGKNSFKLIVREIPIPLIIHFEFRNASIQCCHILSIHSRNNARRTSWVETLVSKSNQ